MTSFRKVTNNVNRHMSKIRRELPTIVREGHREFVRVTPKDTGNAKRKTDLIRNEIQGNYPYSVKLQNGYSKQAPDGMRDDAIARMRTVIRKI